MPRALRSGRIADPVHGYVNFTGVERAILDHPVAQRLRYVAQNGLAHLVFPEVRSSRFSHSLGAMHLTSGFLAACLRNADPDTLQQVGDAIRLSVERVAGEVGDPERAASELITDATLTAHHYCRPAHASSMVLAEQGLRLAALFHDLGHLPFSHDFEHALDFFGVGCPTSRKTHRRLKGSCSKGKVRPRSMSVSAMPPPCCYCATFSMTCAPSRRVRRHASASDSRGASSRRRQPVVLRPRTRRSTGCTP